MLRDSILPFENAPLIRWGAARPEIDALHSKHTEALSLGVHRKLVSP